MRAEAFAGVIAPWKVRLVMRRVRRRGVRGADFDEVAQRVLIALLDFEYRASQSNNATEATAITALIDRQIAYYRRGEARRRSTVDVAALSTEPARDHRQALDAAIDLNDAMAGMPKFTQQVCAALSAGLSVSEAAKQLGVNWHKVRDQVRWLKRRFNRLGLAPVAKPARREAAA